MIEVQIAGAGAGKTYGLAETLIEHIKACTSHKKTYALTYTNTATAKIEQEIIKQHGLIPTNLCIQTVHSFLLNEIIYPFSSFILGDVYNDSSIMSIGNPKYKASLFKQLRGLKVIHAENVYNIAKQILDETISKHNSKIKKAKVQRLLIILESCFEKIFIDEVQDLDSDALRVFEVLGNNGIDVYMIGDPKQAIKYPKALDNFIEKVSTQESTKILPINNYTRRAPKEILAISNGFCYKDQQQESLSVIVGELMYIESTDTNYDKVLKNYIDTNQIVCIDKKIGRYSTSSKHRYAFPKEIELMIGESNHKRDKKLFVKAAFSDYMDCVSKGNTKKAVNTLIARHSLKLTPPNFAQLYELSNKCTENNVQFKIQSIDSVKGLDADTCVIVVSPSILRYLTKNNLNKEEHFNKEWKKVYVALTRAKKKLILAIDHKLLQKSDIDLVRDSIENLGFIYHK
jgi:hypothetical protein